LQPGHGGGPLPLIGQQPDYLKHFESLPSHLPATPLAIIIVSAHWEEDKPSIMAMERNSLLFDYYGFPV
jgi:4,5-DOPA dioxygenase extradiol